MLCFLNACFILRKFSMVFLSFTHRAYRALRFTRGTFVVLRRFFLLCLVVALVACVTFVAFVAFVVFVAPALLVGLVALHLVVVPAVVATGTAGRVRSPFAHLIYVVVILLLISWLL